MSVGENIKRLRMSHNLTQDELGNIAGVSFNAVSQWETSRSVPRMGAIEKMANYFNITTGELLDGAVPGAKKPVGTSAMVPMRILGKTHAGTPTEEIEDIKLVEVPETVACNHPDAFMLQVEGDCMNRSYPDGCLVMVDPTISPWNGCAVVAEPGVGESVLRRYMRGQSSMMLAADSFSAYDDMVFSGEDEVKLVGVVVWYQAAEEEQAMR